MLRSKTIQIFLKDSEPNGIKIAELSNSVAKVYVIPRSQVEYANSRIDLATPALYFLFDDERTSVYIGECENFQHRIYNHSIKKSFWQWAVVLVGNGVSLDKADVKYLESHSVMRAVEAGRFEVSHARCVPPSPNGSGRARLSGTSLRSRAQAYQWAKYIQSGTRRKRVPFPGLVV